MRKRRKLDKSSMRNTPQNKVRRINQALLKCEMALLTLEERSLNRELTKEGVMKLEWRQNGLASHIERLKKARSDWQKGGPRAGR